MPFANATCDMRHRRRFELGLSEIEHLGRFCRLPFWGHAALWGLPGRVWDPKGTECVLDGRFRVFREVKIVLDRPRRGGTSGVRNGVDTE
eukprot:scaffold24693_cov27-Tisochrysis_lutea.AAC.1